MVAEIKSDSCLGFNVRDDNFYFVKDDKSVIKLQME